MDHEYLHNRLRHLEDLITINSWHDKPSTAKNRTADLFVFVNFREADFGGKSEDTIQFKLLLKKAEIVIEVDGQFYVDPQFIWRGNKRSRVARKTVNLNR